jgi:beta-N-acetylhexosaminidase
MGATMWQPGQLLVAGFSGTRLPGDLATRLGEGRIGGVILFQRNIEDPPQLRRLIAEIRDAAPDDAPVLVSIDQEGGRVQRLREPWTEWPPMRRLGEIDDLDLTTQVAQALARELSDLGIHLDYAPVVDVDTNPDNPVIGDRSFSRQPEIVSRHAACFVRAIQQARVAACAKHFPGHGDTITDSHHELPRLPHDLSRLREVELPPFRAAIEAGVAAIMTAHVLFSAIDPRRPATLAPEVIAILRDELAYDGLVISDDFEMKALSQHARPDDLVTLALSAGVDAMLVCEDAELREIVLRRLERMPDHAVERSIDRMIDLKRRFVMPPIPAVPEQTEQAHPPGRVITDLFAALATPPAEPRIEGPPYAAHRALADRITRG